MDYRAILVSQMVADSDDMELAEALFEAGPFDKDECHYLDPSPWPEVGTCDDCVFFSGQAECALIEGDISPDGLCRFYVIPDKGMDEETAAKWKKKKPKKTVY